MHTILRTRGRFGRALAAMEFEWTWVRVTADLPALFQSVWLSPPRFENHIKHTPRFGSNFVPDWTPNSVTCVQYQVRWRCDLSILYPTQVISSFFRIFLFSYPSNSPELTRKTQLSRTTNPGMIQMLTNLDIRRSSSGLN